MRTIYAVVDLFAGPGGLAEGFASAKFDGHNPFSIILSVEKEPYAHATLLLRSFLRQFGTKFPEEYYLFLNGKTSEPDWAKLYPDQWKAADEEALKAELGNPSASGRINSILDSVRRRYGDQIILIGGPPCQAYSLVGRARNKGVKDYRPKDDNRHFLYQEYIRILNKLRPVAFVMENVKGLLSSSVEGEKIFDKVLNDLQSVGEGGDGYRLVTVTPSDFVVRAEQLGIPQARHRVIVIGIKKSALSPALRLKPQQGLLVPSYDKRATLRNVIGGMPRIRSGLSGGDGPLEWQRAVEAAIRHVLSVEHTLRGKQLDEFRARGRHYAKRIRHEPPKSRCSNRPVGIGQNCHTNLRNWLLDPSLSNLPNNETRSHMHADLARYFFAALFGEVTGRSPTASDFPRGLAPEHRNWETGKFADRFRVQLWDAPSTTVTSHISKDGHYFIHPDPEQCRSLTVREAARLQTFPDNYFFKGNRTQQFVQVGNAVPPYLAKLIAESLYQVLAQIIERQKISTVIAPNPHDKNSTIQNKVATAIT